MAQTDLIFQKGLPANLDAERLVLGYILVDDSAFLEVASELEADDFSLESHRRVFARMSELSAEQKKIDRITVANELQRYGHLESIGGLSYLISLDDNLPQIPNLASYIRIVKEKSRLRRIILTSQNIIDRCLTGEEGADQILAVAEESLLRMGDVGAGQALVNPAQIIENFEGGINAFLDPSKRIRGISTGYIKLDEMTGGLHPGELIILAGRPSMGKTALALNIGAHAAASHQNPQTVAVFSLEMSAESLLTRMICASARVDQQKFRAGYLNSDERRRLSLATTQLVNAPLFIDDSAGAGVVEIHAKLRRLQAERGLGLVIVDYLQLMTGRGRAENRNIEVSAISRGLKLLAKELKVPFLVLSQLSRAPEQRPGDHRPQLSDLRESGSIEQDADLVCFIFREELYKPDRDDLRGVAELLVAKQRNGPTGKVKLVFLREFTKFENMTEDLSEAAE